MQLVHMQISAANGCERQTVEASHHSNTTATQHILQDVRSLQECVQQYCKTLMSRLSVELTLALELHFTFSSISFLCKSASRESPMAFCVSRRSSTGLSLANSTTLSCGRNCKSADL